MREEMAVRVKSDAKLGDLHRLQLCLFRGSQKCHAFTSHALGRHLFVLPYPPSRIDTDLAFPPPFHSPLLGSRWIETSYSLHIGANEPFICTPWQRSVFNPSASSQTHPIKSLLSSVSASAHSWHRSPDFEGAISREPTLGSQVVSASQTEGNSETRPSRRQRHPRVLTLFVPW